MSGFEQFATSISKYQIKSTCDIVPVHKVGFILSKSGFYLQRTKIQIERILPVLKSMYEIVPKVVEGPQMMVNTYYKRIMCLSDSLKTSVMEQDKAMPPNLACTGIVSEAFGYLGQFNEYLPNLISNEASKMASYVPALLESLETVSDTFKKALELIPLCEEEGIKNTESIDLEKYPMAHFAAAILYLAEHALIDINFILQNESIQSSTQHTSLLQQWLSVLSQFSDAIFSQALLDSSTLMAIISTVSSVSPNLITTVTSIQNFIENSDDFASTTADVIYLTHLLNVLESKESIDKSKKILENAMNVYVNEKNDEDFFKDLNFLLRSLSNSIKELGIDDSSIAENSYFAQLQKCADKPKLSSLTAYEIVRSSMFTCSDSESAELVLIEMAKQINILISALFDRSKVIAKEIKEIYDNNLIDFNEQSLGEINFCTLSILGMESLSTDDPDYCLNVKKITGLLTSIPSVLTRLTDKCTNDNLKPKLNEIITETEEIADNFSKLSYELIMSLMSVILMRSRVADSTLSFFKISNIKLPDEIETISNTIHITLKEIPHLMLCDLPNVYTLLNSLNNLKLLIDDFKASLDSLENESSLVKIAVISLQLFKKEIPVLSSKLNIFLDFQDRDTFVSVLTGQLVTSFKSIKKTIQNLDENADTAASELAVPFSNLTTVFGMTKNANEEGESVSHFGQTAKPTIDSIWSIVSNLSNSANQESDKNQIKQYMSVLTEMLNDFINVANKLPQPFKECDFPEEIKQLKTYESIANTLPPELKGMAQELIKRFKGKTDAFSQDFLKYWFETVNREIDTKETADNLLKSILELFDKEIIDKEMLDDLLKKFSELSVSILRECYDEPFGSLLLKSHNEIIDLIQKFFESELKDKSVLLEILLKVQEIKSLKALALLSEEEREKRYRSDLEKLLKNLHVLRTKGDDSSFQDIIDSLKYLKDIEVLLNINNQSSEELEELFKSVYSRIVKQDFDSDVLTKVIEEFSKRYLEKNPNTFKDIESVQNHDKLLDMIYNLSENFRKEGTSILKVIKTKDTTQDELIKTISKMGKCSFEGSAVAFHSLKLDGLMNKINNKKSLKSFVKIISTFSKFSPAVLQLLNNESQNDLNNELRKMNRQMAKNFDSFINLVEAPQPNEEKLSEFDLLRLNMISDLVEISYAIDELNCLSVNSIVPEMYEKEKKLIVDKFNKLVPKFEESSKLVVDKSIGETKDMFQEILDLFKNQMQELIESTDKIDFCSDFPAQIILDESSKTSEIISKIIKASELLIDHIIIQPDPNAAALLPDDFTIPSPPESTLSAQEAFELYSKAHEEMNIAIQKFIDGIKDPYAPSETLLNSINQFKLDSANYINSALMMSVSTKDPLLQVEQHTLIHNFSNIFNSIRDSVRSRLMRAGDYDSEMDEALANLRACLAKNMELAEASRNHIEAPPPEDSNDDNVTRELKNTANSIQEMTEKLQEISIQMESTSITSDVDLNDISSLPAFVISEANPILIATQKIVYRAQQITADRVRMYGKIENEKLLINSSQELSKAAALLLIAAEILINCEDDEADFKVIAAARIVKASVSALVAQVLVDGGDPENIMQQQIKIVQIHADNIVKRAQSIVLEKMEEEENKIKQTGSLMVRKLNLQNRINNARKELENEEKVLYQFRKRF